MQTTDKLKTHPHVKDLTGQTFGMLLVERLDKPPAGAMGRGAHWQCKCSCGSYVLVRSDSLVQGKSTCCGCTNPSTTHMRAAIKPRRTKSTASVQSAQDATELNPESIPSMNETQGTFSTASIPLGELVTLRNDLRGLHSNSRGTKAALRWLDGQIDTASRAAHPAAYANENDKPRHVGLTPGQPDFMTVKGETMGEQTARFTLPAATPNPGKAVRKHTHYFKDCPYEAIDVYRVLSLFGVTDPAIAHAVKKLLVAGGRGAGKDITQDVREAIDTCERFLEMHGEDVKAGYQV